MIRPQVYWLRNFEGKINLDYIGRFEEIEKVFIEISKWITKNMKNKVALVIGAGNNLGAAIARCFSSEGYTVVAARRSGDKLITLQNEIEAKGGIFYGYSLDARKEDDVINFIKEVETNVGPIEVAIYNIGGNIKFSITETTSQKYYKTWEMAAFGAFLIAPIIVSIAISIGTIFPALINLSIITPLCEPLATSALIISPVE